MMFKLVKILTIVLAIVAGTIWSANIAAFYIKHNTAPAAVTSPVESK